MNHQEIKKDYIGFPEKVTFLDYRSIVILFVIALFWAIMIVYYKSSMPLPFLILLVVFLGIVRINKKIERTFRDCQLVIRENQNIAGRHKSIANDLIIEEKNLNYNEIKRIKKYMLLSIPLLLILIYNFFNTNYLPNQLFAVVASGSMFWFSIATVKDALEYCRNILENNTKQIYSDKKLNIPQPPPWNYYIKRWDFFILIFVLLTLISFATQIILATEKTLYFSLYAIIFFAIFLLIFIVNDINQILNKTLKILNKYDYFIKEKYNFFQNLDYLQKVDSNELTFMDSSTTMISEANKGLKAAVQVFRETKTSDEYKNDIRRLMKDIKHILKNFIK